MKRYNVGECSQFMGESWKDDLVRVVDTAVSLGFFNISESACKDIDHEHAWNSGRCGLGMQRKQDNLKEMAKYSLYEIAVGMSKEQLSYNTLKELFTILSQDGFPNASYSYAVMLLQKKMSETSQENVKKAIRYLDDAILVGCKGAELLLGTLLFKSSTSRILSASQKEHYITKLEEYISRSDDSYLMNKRNVDMMTLCLAEQYYIQKSRLVEHDEEKAERMLLSRCLNEEWINLKQRSQKGLSSSNSSISSVGEEGLVLQSSSREHIKKRGSYVSHNKEQDLQKTHTTLQMKHSCSIPSVSGQEFNPTSSSTMRRAEGVAGNSVLDATSDDKSISNSNKSPTFLEREQERRERESVDREDWPTF